MVICEIKLAKGRLVTGLFAKMQYGDFQGRLFAELYEANGNLSNDDLQNWKNVESPKRFWTRWVAKWQLNDESQNDDSQNDTLQSDNLQNDNLQNDNLQDHNLQDHNLLNDNLQNHNLQNDNLQNNDKSATEMTLSSVFKLSFALAKWFSN